MLISQSHTVYLVMNSSKGFYNNVIYEFFVYKTKCFYYYKYYFSQIVDTIGTRKKSTNICPQLHNYFWTNFECRYHFFLVADQFGHQKKISDHCLLTPSTSLRCKSIQYSPHFHPPTVCDLYTNLLSFSSLTQIA